MSTVVGKSDFGRASNEVYSIITWTWVTVGVFLVVLCVLVYAMIRYRERADTRLPRQIRGHSLLEIAWTIAPALVLLVIAIPTVQIIFRTQTSALPGGALDVTVMAHQWPILMALGIAVAAAGALISVWVGIVGALIAVAGLFRFALEHHANAAPAHQEAQ